MKLVGKSGRRLLFEKPDGTGVVKDTVTGRVWNDGLSVQSILGHGRWRDPEPGDIEKHGSSHDESDHGNWAKGRKSRRQSARALRREALTQGGFTIKDTTGMRPHKGYMVAIEGAEVKVPIKDLTAERIRQYRQRFKDLLDDPGNYFGAWVNTEDGYCYLDISRRFRNKDKAIEFGQKSGQLAIFHLDTFDTISLAKRGKGWVYVPLRKSDSPFQQYKAILSAIDPIEKHGDSHDESAHGNWADDDFTSKPAKAPKKTTRKTPAKDYEGGYAAGLRGSPDALERADQRNASRAWYLGFHDAMAGDPKWTLMDRDGTVKG